MKDRHAEDWEELAQRDPFYAVLTREEFRGIGTGSPEGAAFLETGEREISELLDTVAALLSRRPALHTALDFGCGVGRLTLPLARRSDVAIACDVAPTMLEHTQANARLAGLENIRPLLTSQLDEVPPGSIDFICSFLVFQHVPPAVGYALIRTLTRLLAPSGVGALHVTFRRPGGVLRRFARSLRARSRLLHRLAGILRREDTRLPYMQMNAYDESVVLRNLEADGARVAGTLATQHGDTAGAVLIIERLS